MNWRRIFATVALGGWVLLIGGVIWLGPRHDERLGPQQPSTSRFASSHATVVLELTTPDPIPLRSSAGETAIRTSEIDGSTFVAILRSLQISQAAFASLSPEEFSRVLGPQFVSTGKSEFRGVRIEPTRKEGKVHITLTSSHRDPDAARLIAERLYTELIKYFRRREAEMDEFAMRYLSEARTKSIAQVRTSESAFAEVQGSQDAKPIRTAEDTVRITRQRLRQIEARIASTTTAAKAPTPLPFHVFEARLVIGPFWNRTETDFTSEVARLEGL